MTISKRHIAALSAGALAIVLLDILPGSVFGRQTSQTALNVEAVTLERSPDQFIPEALKTAAIDPLDGPWGDEPLTYPVTDRERAQHCLALNIYWEARSEPVEGQKAVAAVTLNRMKNDAYPDDICAVVRQGGAERLHLCQFSWWCDGKSDLPTEQKAWESSMQLAGRVLDGKIKDPTKGAMWYHADYVKPAWSRKKVRITKIGRHIFYRALQPGESLQDQYAMN